MKKSLEWIGLVWFGAEYGCCVCAGGLTYKWPKDIEGLELREGDEAKMQREVGAIANRGLDGFGSEGGGDDCKQWC